MRKIIIEISGVAGLVVLLACLILVPGCSEDPDTPSDPGPTPIPTRGLLAFYPFNGDELDASGNDNNASLMGSASITTFLTIGNNNTDALSLPYTIFEGMGNFTVSVWGRITTPHDPGSHFIISGASAGQDNVLYLGYITASSSWQLHIQPSDIFFGPSASMSDLEWHHIVVLRNGSIARFYIDNKEIGDGSASPSVAIDIDPGGLIIGQDQDGVGVGFQTGQSWAGDLDNYRIYNRALTRSEIRALYEETGWGD